MGISVAALSRIASTYAAGVLPPGSHQSLPVPQTVDGQPRVGFMYCRAEARDPSAGLQLWPPTYVARVDAEQGTFDQLVATTQESFGMRGTVDRPLGAGMTQDQLLSDSHLTGLARLYQAMDLLLPEFFAGAGLDRPELVAAAEACGKQFHEVAEPVLLPYYESLGSQFFSWLGDR